MGVAPHRYYAVSVDTCHQSDAAQLPDTITQETGKVERMGYWPSIDLTTRRVSVLRCFSGGEDETTRE